MTNNPNTLLRFFTILELPNSFFARLAMEIILFLCFIFLIWLARLISLQISFGSFMFWGFIYVIASYIILFRAKESKEKSGKNISKIKKK